MIRLSVLTLLIAVIGLFAGVTQSAAIAPASVVAGDVNCDGSLTPLDALDYLSSIAGTETPAACLETNGDLTCDESADEQDLIEALYALVGIERPLAVAPPPAST